MLLTMSTTHPRTNGFLNLLSYWHVHKAESTFFKRLSMRCLEVVALAVAMLFVPLTMHRAVRGLDEVYELLDRRAQSPYAIVSWTSIVTAAVMLLGWHIWLGRLSYRTVLEAASTSMNDVTIKPAEREALEERKSQEARISWGRILSRLVVPCLLLTLGSHFVFQIFTRIKDPRPRIIPNTVDMQEAMGQLYGFK
jgi:NADH:ubiquinone oxidoreductase subunit 5 (subunit L)/multisubunit Na+/H+ antiporter MnhA subunit